MSRAYLGADRMGFVTSRLECLNWKHTLHSHGNGMQTPNSASNPRKNPSPPASGTAEATGAVNLGPGTPVRPTSILVVGATGTLGRQIVRRALDEGYDVRCLVRPRPAPADFLRDWGATVVNADLSKPETTPATMVGVHTIIDCATGRPEQPIKTTGKEKLLLYNVQKQWEYRNMCSILFTTVTSTLKFQDDDVNMKSTILEEKSVSDAPTRIAYMDTQVITLCERLAGQDANVTTVPVSILRFTRQLTGFFEWTNDVADRLAFSELTSSHLSFHLLAMLHKASVLSVRTSDIVFSVPMNGTYNLLGVDQKDIVTLEKYLQDYFTNILKKLKDLKAQSKQSDFYI
uniref:NmrA-like domain-containing protein n=1 Tax=Populus alba TaxID=43335 RepID=A0A4U5P5A1_POPAL|nr:hypothetical protein D5086_0000223180 [Populus alba]